MLCNIHQRYIIPSFNFQTISQYLLHFHSIYRLACVKAVQSLTILRNLLQLLFTEHPLRTTTRFFKEKSSAFFLLLTDFFIENLVLFFYQDAKSFNLQKGKSLYEKYNRKLNIEFIPSLKRMHALSSCESLVHIFLFPK